MALLCLHLSIDSLSNIEASVESGSMSIHILGAVKSEPSLAFIHPLGSTTTSATLLMAASSHDIITNLYGRNEPRLD